MSLISRQFSKYAPLRGARVSRLLCAMLCLFFLTAVPTLAEPIRINQVVQTLQGSQGAPDLKLNNLVNQDPVQKGGTPSGPRSDNGRVTRAKLKARFAIVARFSLPVVRSRSGRSCFWPRFRSLSFTAATTVITIRLRHRR